MSDRRAGYTLAEAIVALAVAAVLIACLAVLLFAVGRAALRHAEVAAAVETERTVAAILGAELRAATSADVAAGRDSVRLRAFRGAGAACASGPGTITVAYRGARMPEDDKDSVLVIGAAGEAAFDLEGASAAAECGPGSLRLALASASGEATRGALLALVFETGTYSIASAAFRYRRGNAGRQPLTEENLSTAGSHMDAVARGSAAALRLTLRTAGSRRAPPAEWMIGMLQGRALPERAP